MNVLAKNIPWKAYQTTISKSREYQSLNKVFRAGLHLDTGAYASYGLNPTPQSPIGSECVDMKGETSHATLNIVIETGDCYPPT